LWADFLSSLLALIARTRQLVPSRIPDPLGSPLLLKGHTENPLPFAREQPLRTQAFSVQKIWRAAERKHRGKVGRSIADKERRTIARNESTEGSRPTSRFEGRQRQATPS
jgi:hypothetical protein